MTTIARLALASAFVLSIGAAQAQDSETIEEMASPEEVSKVAETLSKIEQAEDYLHSLGLREVRARHHDRLCRVEVGENELETAFGYRKEIAAELKKIGYLWVSLDLAGLRSGSLNDQLKITLTTTSGEPAR